MQTITAGGRTIQTVAIYDTDARDATGDRRKALKIVLDGPIDADDLAALQVSPMEIRDADGTLQSTQEHYTVLHEHSVTLMRYTPLDAAQADAAAAKADVSRQAALLDKVRAAMEGNALLKGVLATIWPDAASKAGDGT